MIFVVRQFKYLLKKVDFLNWKQDANLREIRVMRRYHIQDREYYHKYNKLAGSLRSYAHRLSLLPSQDPSPQIWNQRSSTIYRHPLQRSEALRRPERGHRQRVLRRLAVVMCAALRMSESVSALVKFVEQGHVRVGPDTVTDPAFLVTKHMEDFVTRVDTSKLRKTVIAYNDKLDDFDLL
ncbi:IMP3_1 [Sanghuangporus sanghuang]